MYTKKLLKYNNEIKNFNERVLKDESRTLFSWSAHKNLFFSNLFYQWEVLNSIKECKKYVLNEISISIFQQNSSNFKINIYINFFYFKKKIHYILPTILSTTPVNFTNEKIFSTLHRFFFNDSIWKEKSMFCAISFEIVKKNKNKIFFKFCKLHVIILVAFKILKNKNKIKNNIM